MVLPPPQPTSRILEFLLICTCRRPQSVNPECEAFIIHKNGLPTHREGFRTWWIRYQPAPTAAAYRTATHPHGTITLAPSSRRKKRLVFRNFKKPLAPYSTWSRAFYGCAAHNATPARETGRQ